MIVDGERRPSISYSYEYNREYDENGNLINLTYTITHEKFSEDGTSEVTVSDYAQTYKYTYDAKGRVAMMVLNNGTESVYTYTYDGFDNVERMICGNAVTTYEYIKTLEKVEQK